MRCGTPLALFAAALLVRAGPWREVLATERVVPVGNDAFYHLRRITYNSPLRFDRRCRTFSGKWLGRDHPEELSVDGVILTNMPIGLPDSRYCYLI